MLQIIPLSTPTVGVTMLVILLRVLMLLIKLLILRWSKKAVNPDEYPENHFLESFYG